MSKTTAKEVKKLVAASWAPATHRGYNTMLGKWRQYCKVHDRDPLTINFKEGLDFLVWLHNVRNHNYDTIAAARSAISAVAPLEGGVTFGKDPTVSKVVKGMFRERPRIPKKMLVYDTNIVLRYMESLPGNKELPLELLTKKLTTLLCILSGQRSQSIASLYMEHMCKTESLYTFFIPKLLKTTTPTFHQEPLEFEAFPQNDKLCVHDCLTEYLERKNSINSVKKDDKSTLIISYAPPNRSVKSATLARYVKDFLGMAGIDVTVFTTHSTRAASTSKLNNLGMSLKDLSKAAGWKGQNTFQKYYKFKVCSNFGTEVIKAVFL